MKAFNRQPSRGVRRRLAESLAPGLREEYLRLNSLIEQASDGIFLADLNTGRYTYVNSAGARMLGYTPEEVVGKTIMDLIPPEEVPKLAESKLIQQQGVIHVAEYRLKRKDGVYIPTEVSAKILPDGRWQGLVRDISERIEMQRRLQRSIDALNRAQAVAKIGSWRLDVRRNELHWSDENYRIFGVPRGRPQTYETFLERVHPDDRAHVDAQWNAALRGAPYRIEHRIVVGDQVKWVCETADLQFDEHGELVGGIGTTQDITETKMTDQALAEAREAEQRLREEWASIIAHDLRQPVSAIRVCADILTALHEGDRNEREGKVIARIEDASRRLSRMIDELLDASQVEAHRLAVYAEQGDLAALIRDIVEQHGDVTPASPTTIEAPETLVAHFDADRIRQVMENLLSNATKYGAAPPQIRVSVGMNCDEAEVVVTNRGPGIPADKMPRLFSRFSRLRQARQGQTDGLGLGLYISRGLVEAQGGRIWAESTPGETTSFHFTVPRAPPAAAGHEEPASPRRDEERPSDARHP